MKFNRRLLVAGVAAACSWMGSENSMAANDHTVTIQAMVTGKCKFNAASSTIVLSIDPAATTTITALGNILYRCTRGTTPAFDHVSTSTGSSSSGRLSAGAEGFAYGFSGSGASAGGGMGSGQDRTHVVTITVDQAVAANVTPATYSDTIVISVNP